MPTTLHTTPHPLFAPASRYSSYRMTFAARDKMHGYLRWVARVAAREEVADPAALPAAARAAVGHQPRHLYFLTDGTDVTNAVSESQVRLVAGATGQLSVQLTFRLDSPPVFMGGLPAQFRAFLLEPLVFARLAKAVGRGESAEVGPTVTDTLSEVIGSVGDNIEVARILSAVPELEGELRPDGYGEAIQTLPALPGTPDVPARALVVVVLASEALDGLGPIEKAILLNDPLGPASLVRQLHELREALYTQAGCVSESCKDAIVASVVGGEEILSWPSASFGSPGGEAILHGVGDGAALVGSGVVRFEQGSVVVAAGRYPASDVWSFFCLASSSNPATAARLEVFALRGAPIPSADSTPYDLVESGHVLGALHRARQAGWTGRKLEGLHMLALGRQRLLMGQARQQAGERRVVEDYLLKEFEDAGETLLAGALHAASERLQELAREPT